jgi:hypothetical protein
MKASCHRRRHSRRTDTHVTYWDPFPLAQWQRNSSRDSRHVAKPAPPTGALVAAEAATAATSKAAAAASATVMSALILKRACCLLTG